MKKVTTSITYKVSDGHYCNIDRKSKEMCRFCVKDKYGYRCALYNMPLDVHESVYVLKTRACEKTMCGFPSVVDLPDDEVKVDPRQIMKMTLDTYDKLKKQLAAQGFPQAMAEQLAKKMVLEDK